MRNSPLICFVILSITSAAPAAEGFRPRPADTYAHQSAQQVTIGAQPFDKPELVEQAFSKKVDLLKYGVLPVLVVIENNSKETLDLQNLEVHLVASDGRQATAVAPYDLYQLGKRSRPTGIKTPIPLPKKRNPMESDEIVIRSFSAKVLPSGDSASGFFYFEARAEKDDKLYVNGIRQARSKQEIMYFEFPVVK